jgi:hypothetical protein
MFAWLMNCLSESRACLGQRNSNCRLVGTGGEIRRQSRFPTTNAKPGKETIMYSVKRIAIAWIALFALAIDPMTTATAATTGNLLTDPGWDTPLTNPLGGFIPVFNGPIFDTWGAEVGGVVGAENGITPAAGNGMLRQFQTSLVATQSLQLLDVTSYAADIDANNVTVELNSLFNVPSVLAGAVANVTIRYRDALETYIGPTASASISLDGSAATWEPSSIVGFPVVPGTRRIHAEVAYTNASFIANPNMPAYTDVADLRLTIVPEPSAFLLLALAFGGVASSRRRGR